MYKIGVDIGGTFTDCMVLDGTGRQVTAKSPTTPSNRAQGVMNAVSLAAEELGLTRKELLSRTSHFVHGCTVATNAMVERKGVRTGLLTTKGHEDAMRIGRASQKIAGLGERETAHSSRWSKPKPIVQQKHIHGISERIDRYGEIIVHINEDEVRKAVQALCNEGIEALAISYLWSFINPVHEQQTREIVKELAPHLYVTISSELAPVLGEYERTVTTAMNAYIAPQLLHYLRDLEQQLYLESYKYPLLIMQATGGVMTTKHAENRAILTLDSGPVGGTLGARFFGKLYGEENVICTDVGGTTFDVSLVANGEIQLDQEPVIDQFAYRMPKILIHSVGAGGGSIAWVNDIGGLHVGPMSAGSEPGPVCYDQGGENPTVTDADLLLGYLNPDNFWNGRMKLNKEKVLKAMRQLAEQLSMGEIELAEGIFRITNSQMADLIRGCTIERGFDPRDFVLVAFGGMGATHAAYYAEEIGAKAVIIFDQAAVFSAFGMLTSELAHISQRSNPMLSPFSEEQIDDMNQVFEQLDQEVLEQFKYEGLLPEDVSLLHRVLIRYDMQVHEMSIDIPNRTLTMEDVNLITQRFEEKYKLIYGEGSTISGARLEIMTFQVYGTASKVLDEIEESLESETSNPVSALKGERDAYFAETGGFVSTPIYDGALLETGFQLAGPAIVERKGDTVLIPPHFNATVDRYRSIVIRPKAADTRQTTVAVGVGVEEGGSLS